MTSLLDKLDGLEGRIRAALPGEPDIIKTPLLNILGGISHLRDARRTHAALTAPPVRDKARKGTDDRDTDAD